LFTNSLRRPNLPAPWSVLLIAYAVGSSAFWAAVLAVFHLPLPFGDYTITNELADLQRRDPAAHQARLRELVASMPPLVERRRWPWTRKPKK
jgi:hypothetical protein